MKALIIHTEINSSPLSLSSSPTKTLQSSHKRTTRSLSKVRQIFDWDSPKGKPGETKYRENWYQEQRVVYPKKSLLDKVQQKQEIFLFRKNDTDSTRLKSSVHGFARRVNSEQYFGTLDKLAQLQKYYSMQANMNAEQSKKEQGNEKNEEKDKDNNGDNNKQHFSEQVVKLPPIVGNQRRSSSLDYNSQEVKSYPSQGNIAEISSKLRTEEASRYNPNQGGFNKQNSLAEFKNKYLNFNDTASDNTQQTEIDSSKQQSQDDNTQQFTSIEQLKEQRLVTQEKIKDLISKIKEVEARLLQFILSNENIKQIIEVLLPFKIQDSAALIARFFRFCLELQAVLGSNKKSKQTSVDPKSLKGLLMTVEMVLPLEEFCTSQLDRCDLKKEKIQFKKIWRQQCLNWLLVDDLLLEIGGTRRLEFMIKNLVLLLERHFEKKISSTSKEYIKSFALMLFQDSPPAIPSHFAHKSSNAEKRLQLTCQDIFVVKHFVFLELAKEERIPWERKIRILEKLERLRYDGFRESYLLSSCVEIVESMKSLCPQSLLNKLNFQTNQQMADFFAILNQSILGNGTPCQLLEKMAKDKYSMSLETISMLETLMKQSLTISKNSPHILWKSVEYKFIVLKRNLRIHCSFESISAKMNEILFKMNIIILALLKYMSVSQQEKNIYTDLSFFSQILVESCSNSDVFTIEDVIYGLTFYGIQEKHFLFWIKSLKRVMLEMRFSPGEVQNISIHLLKVMEDSKV